MTDQLKLSIVGDRQTGKTHLALLGAIFDACNSKRVLWQGFNGIYAQENMRNAEDLLAVLGVQPQRVTRANGKWGIEFVGDGYIHFRPPARTRGLGNYDTHIIDDVQDVNAQPLPTADRVIRTVCTNRHGR